mmetsp:Transcript_96555/g.258168  ORF Transcript_96555/g.258168 Transcript_96555/m.258168 type:complete len:352 (+) Transcript_96555:39-1094(+)
MNRFGTSGGFHTARDVQTAPARAAYGGYQRPAPREPRSWAGIQARTQSPRQTNQASFVRSAASPSRGAAGQIRKPVQSFEQLKTQPLPKFAAGLRTTARTPRERSRSRSPRRAAPVIGHFSSFHDSIGSPAPFARNLFSRQEDAGFEPAYVPHRAADGGHSARGVIPLTRARAPLLSTEMRSRQRSQSVKARERPFVPEFGGLRQEQNFPRPSLFPRQQSVPSLFGSRPTMDPPRSPVRPTGMPLSPRAKPSLFSPQRQTTGLRPLAGGFSPKPAGRVVGGVGSRGFDSGFLGGVVQEPAYQPYARQTLGSPRAGGQSLFGSRPAGSLFGGGQAQAPSLFGHQSTSFLGSF